MVYSFLSNVSFSVDTRDYNVDYLLTVTLNPSCCLQRNMNALHYVAQHGFDREASLLVEARINIDASDNVSNVSCHVLCIKHE